MAHIKRYTIYAGVNGAGKSTLYRIEKEDDNAVRLNSDEIIKKSGGDWKDVSTQVKAGKVLLAMQEKAFADGVSINRETTLCGSNIFKSIKKAKELGYMIDLRYVGVNNIDIAKERVAKRIVLGGHGVSEKTIERRYATTRDGFLSVFPYCDKVRIYDNSGEYPVLVAYKVNEKIVKTNIDCEWVDTLLAEL